MLRTERQSARISKIKNGGLEQYDTGPFEQQQFGTAGVEGVKGRKLRLTLSFKKYDPTSDSILRKGDRPSYDQSAPTSAVGLASCA